MLSGVKNLNYFPLIRTSVYHPIPSGNMAEKNGGKAAKLGPDELTPLRSGGYSNMSQGLKMDSCCLLG